MTRKPSCCLVFKNQGKKYAITRNLGFLCIGWGRKQKTNEKPGRNPRSQKTVRMFWLDFCENKRIVHTSSGLGLRSSQVSPSAQYYLRVKLTKRAFYYVNMLGMATVFHVIRNHYL
jgi:hypothetical protein